MFFPADVIKGNPTRSVALAFCVGNAATSTAIINTMKTPVTAPIVKARSLVIFNILCYFIFIGINHLRNYHFIV
jgi:hypothetical protein